MTSKPETTRKEAAPSSERAGFHSSASCLMRPSDEGANSCNASAAGLNWLAALLAGVFCASIFIVNWDIDEGVISLFTDYLQKTGDLRYLFQHHNCRFSFSWPYFYLLAAVRGNAFDPDTFYLLRLPSLVLCVLSLVAVHESLKAFVNDRAVRILALLFFVACCLQLGATRARYDSPYLFGASVALLAASRLHQRGSWLWACVGLLAAAFSGTSHPVGLGAMGFMGIAMLCHILVRRPTKTEAAIIATTSALSACLLIAGLLVGRTPGEFLTDLQGVQDRFHTFTSTTVLDEKGRYLSVLQTWGFLAKLFVACIAAGLVWPSRGEQRSGIWPCRLGFWFLVAFLALIPTKWPYYFGLLLPCATVLGAYHLANLFQWRVFPSRRGWVCANDLLRLRRATVGGLVAMGLAAYLTIRMGHDLWISAHTNTLLARLVRPNGKQATACRQLSEMLEGKSINLYSDMTIVPLLGKADFQRHSRWQPDVGIGEEIDLADSGEFLVVSDRHRQGTYGYVERHSQVDRFPPEKLLTVCFFNDTFTIYRIHQKETGQAPQFHDQSTAGVGSDARLQ